MTRSIVLYQPRSQSTPIRVTTRTTTTRRVVIWLTLCIFAILHIWFAGGYNDVHKNFILSMQFVTAMEGRGYADSSSPSMHTYWIPSIPNKTQLLHEHLSRAWTDANGTEIAKLRNDPNLSRVRNGTCPITTRMRLDTSQDPWLLTSYGPDGTPKDVGGDEFYVSLVHHQNNNNNNNNTIVVAAAHVTDLLNGTYSLGFVRTPPFGNNDDAILEDVLLSSNGLEFRMDMEYTCGIGSIPPPGKNKWISGGALMVPYRNVVVSTAPVLHPFRNRIKERGIDLTPYDQIILYGDSNMHLWYQYAKRQAPPHKLVWTRNPQSGLTTNTVFTKYLRPLKSILQEAKKKKKNTTTTGGDQKLALIVGSSTWDLAFGDRHGKDFALHRQGCNRLIRALRGEFGDVDIYWWSGLDLHVHRARVNPAWASAYALKYMSHSRAQYLYELQIDLMKSLDVPVIDFFEASVLSAHWMPFADARHYDATFYRGTMQMLFPQRQAAAISTATIAPMVVV